MFVVVFRGLELRRGELTLSLARSVPGAGWAGGGFHTLLTPSVAARPLLVTATDTDKTNTGPG